MEFSNDELTCIVHKQPKCKIEFELTAHAPLIEKAKKEAVKQVSKEVTVPGFRKGKAPKDLVEKKHPGQIQKETKQKLANLAFSTAMKEAKTPLLNRDTSVSYSLNEYKEQEAKMTFSFETEPTPPSIPVEKCTIKEPKKDKIGKKEVDEAIRQLRFFFAKWTPITDRPIEEGDFVIIDLETIDEPKQKVYADTRFEVTDKTMASWMKKALLGKNTGDKAEAVSEPDKDLSEEEKKQYSSKHVLITVKKIEKAELPKLDEEFAKKMGTSTIEELRTAMEKNLTQKAEEKADQELRNQINQFLLTHTFDLPDSLIQAEFKHRKDEAMQNPKVEWDKLNESQKKEVEEALLAQAEEAVRLFYLSRAIVKQENIDVSTQSVQEEAIRSMQQLGVGHIDPKNMPPELYTLAFSKVILKKSQDHILEKCLTRPKEPQYNK